MSNNPYDLIPDIDFCPQKPEELLSEMIADYESEYFRITGEKISLAPATRDRIIINTAAYWFYLAYRKIDNGCKMNLPKYSRDGFLDNLAAWSGLTRKPAQKSVSRAKFTLSAAQEDSVLIPRGTRLSTTTNVFFETENDAYISAGDTETICDIISIESGAHTSGFFPGQINILVDPIPRVSSAVNIDTSQGGVDIESDESIQIKIFYQPDSLSVAGPLSAYIYFVKQYSQAIEDVKPFRPSPGVVDIRLTLQGGELPEQAFINKIYEHLEDKRPDTDMLMIGAPTIALYDVDFTYYIPKSEQGRKTEIMANVTAATQEYIKWQNGKIGRDITPDMLTKLIVAAGAKRVPIRSPVYAKNDEVSICRHGAVNVEFGGIEDG